MKCPGGRRRGPELAYSAQTSRLAAPGGLSSAARPSPRHDRPARPRRYSRLRSRAGRDRSPPRPSPSCCVLAPCAHAAAARQDGGSAAARAAAPSPGSGGWFWPAGSEDFGGYAGFLDPRGSNVHVAQDMHSKKGAPVYAIGDGTVWIARADTGGYGVGGKPGGCIIIVHRTGAGEEFRALYGHVSKLTVKDGDRVTPGQQIAVVNGLAHLHFGIHPSAEYRDRNPYAGEVPKKWKDHGGWVDPVVYLRANPRGASYAPPALPVVKIQTGATPAEFGAAAGVAYWTEKAGETPGTFAQDLGDGTRRQLAAGEAPPPFDSARYAVNLLAVTGGRVRRARPPAGAHAGRRAGRAGLGQGRRPRWRPHQRGGQAVRARRRAPGAAGRRRLEDRGDPPHRRRGGLLVHVHAACADPPARALPAAGEAAGRGRLRRPGPGARPP